MSKDSTSLKVILGRKSAGIPRVALSPQERLRVRLNGALANVVAVECYVDTLSVWTRFRPYNEAAAHRYREALRKRLCAMNGGRPVVLDGNPPRGIAFGISQPNEAVREFIHRLDLKHTVYRHDLAVDLITETVEEAQSVAKFILNHLVQPHRREKHRVTVHQNTTYFRGGTGRTSRDIAIYTDKPSKLSGRPCAHVEFRLRTLRACQSFGINQAKDHVTDLADFLDHSGALAIVSPKIIREMVDRNADKWAWDSLAYDLGIFGVDTVNEFIQRLRVQNWRDYPPVKKLRSQRFGLVKLPLSSLLSVGSMVRRQVAHF